MEEELEPDSFQEHEKVVDETVHSWRMPDVEPNRFLVVASVAAAAVGSSVAVVAVGAFESTVVSVVESYSASVAGSSRVVAVDDEVAVTVAG